ncbi:unnamed protein product, partial [marine sediment metagenome]
SPEAQRIVTAGFGDAVRVWDAGSGEELLQARPAPSSWGVAIDPTGALLVAMSDDPIARLYDLSTLDELGRFVGHTDGGIDATISADGRRVVTTSNDGTARVWSVDDQQELLVFNEHTGGVVSAEFSPDGELVATAGNDGRVLIWEVDTGAVQLELTGHAGQLGQVSWHPSGRELAVASGGGVAQVFDISAGGSREVLTIEADPGGVGEADLSPDGMLIATVGSDQTARIFAADTAELIAEFPPAGDVLTS